MNHVSFILFAAKPENVIRPVRYYCPVVPSSVKAFGAFICFYFQQRDYH